MSASAREIQRADPAYRRRFIALVFVIAVAGTAGLAVFEPWFNAVALHDPDTGRRAAWAVVLGASCAPAVVSVYLFVMAARVRRAQRYPPPGLKVARDTAVRTGDEARRIAVWFTAGAVFLAVGAVGVPVMFLRFLRMLGATL